MQHTLKAVRTKKRMSKAELARKAGINKSTVGRIEEGLVKPLHETVTALETAMDLEPGTLVFGQNAAAS